MRERVSYVVVFQKQKLFSLFVVNVKVSILVPHRTLTMSDKRKKRL